MLAKPKPKVATFGDDLRFSLTKEGTFDHIYHTYFKNVKAIRRISRMDRQRSGVDTEVTLDSGETIVIQEKWARKRFLGKFLIEQTSVERNGIHEKPGWIYTIDADYIFMAYQESELVKIYPVSQLKLAWSKYKNAWCNLYRPIPIKNQTYNTWIVLIPCDVLERAINEMMTFSYQRAVGDSFGSGV
jgi:hypothetical protein